MENALVAKARGSDQSRRPTEAVGGFPRTSARTRRRWPHALRNVLAGLLLVFACNGGDDEGEGGLEKRCLRMRDHLIDLRLQQPREPDSDPVRNASVAAQHRAALTAALGEDFAVRCATGMSEAQIDCVMAATDNQAVVACNVR